MAAPDWIPEDALEDYNFFESMGDVDAIKELEDLYRPAEVKPAAPQIQAPEVFVDPMQEVIDVEQQAAQQRTQAEADALAQAQAGYEKFLLLPTSEFYQQVLQDTVIDPSMKSAIERIDKDFTADLDDARTKLFRALVEQNIRKGQDIITAQNNASASLIGITRAERTMQGFTAPPIKQGEAFKASEIDDPNLHLGGFARQTLVTQAQAEEKAKRQAEADKEKSKMFRNFAQQAVQELKASGQEYEPSDVADRAKELEKNFVGSIFGNFYELARQSYLNEIGMTLDEFNALPVSSEEKQTVRDVATFYHEEFVNNLYPEYSGDENVMAAAGLSISDEGDVVPTPPTFMGEVMMDTGSDTGVIKETRTGQALRGVAGLIRPVTLGLTDVLSYEVYTDPETGGLVYPEGEGYFFQQPMTVTKERAEQGYTERLKRDISETRTLTNDFMEMPMLVEGIGEENAGILGMGVDVMLPVTPVGLIAPAAKVGSMGAAALSKVGGKTGAALRSIAQSKYLSQLEKLEQGANVSLTRVEELVEDVAQAEKALAVERTLETPDVNMIASLEAEVTALKAEQQAAREASDAINQELNDLRYGSTLGEGEKYKTAAKGAEWLSKVSDVLVSKPLEEFGKFSENMVGNTIQWRRNKQVDNVLRETQFDITDVNAASKKLTDDLIRLTEESGANPTMLQEKLMDELKSAIKYLDDFSESGRKTLTYLDRVQIPTEALKRLLETKPQQVQAVINDIIQSQRLIEEALANGVKNIDPTTSFGIRFWNGVTELAGANRYVPEAQQLLEDLAQSNGKITPNIIAQTDQILKDSSFRSSFNHQVVKGYLDDYLFNFLPENFVFISPKAAVSTRAYKKFGQQINEDLAKFWKGTLSEGTDGTINFAPKSKEDVTKLFEELQRNYGGSPPQVIQNLKNKLADYIRMTDTEGAVISLNQQEMNLLHTSMKENMYQALSRGDVVKPRRATRTAVERADVPLPRRNELFRSIRETLRKVSPKVDPSLDYAKASQYGLTRLLQKTEQELSMLPQRLEAYAKESLDRFDGDTPMAYDYMLRQQATNLGLQGEFDILHSLMKLTFNMDGISDDILDSFIRNEMARISQADEAARLAAAEAGIPAPPTSNLVDMYNKLYDKFIETKGGKEIDTLGGKYFERKQTAIPMTIFIANGFKNKITSEIVSELEVLHPELFYKKYKTPEEITLAKEQQMGINAQAEAVKKQKLEQIVKDHEQAVANIREIAKQDTEIAKATEEAAGAEARTAFEEVETAQKARIAQAKVKDPRTFRDTKDTMPDDLIKETQEKYFALPARQAQEIQVVNDALANSITAVDDGIKALKEGKAARIRESVQDLQEQIDAFPQQTLEQIAEEEARLQKELEYYQQGNMTNAVANTRAKLATVKKDITDARATVLEDLKTQRAEKAAAEKTAVENEIEELKASKTSLREEAAASRETIKENIAEEKYVLQNLLDGKIEEARLVIDQARATRQAALDEARAAKESALELAAEQKARSTAREDIRVFQERYNLLTQEETQLMSAVHTKYPDAYPQVPPDLRLLAQPSLDIGPAIAKNVYRVLGQELDEALTNTQVARINALLSDLYEGGDIIKFQKDLRTIKAEYIAPPAGEISGTIKETVQAVGQYVMEAQSGLFLSQAVRSILTKTNLNKIKTALKDVPMEELVEFTKGIEVPPEAVRLAGLVTPEDILFSKVIIASIQDNALQSMESLFGFNATGIISALENIGFPPVATKFTADGLRPILVEFNGKGVMALPQDIQILNALKQQSIEGTLGQTLEILSRKSESAGQYALSSLYYAIQGSITSAKGGMLGGTFAPTGKYITVNTITAPLIQMYTTPSITSKSLLKYIAGASGGLALDALMGTPYLFSTAGAMLSGPLAKLLQATIKTSVKAGGKTSKIVSGIGGASIGGFAAGPLGAGVGLMAGTTLGHILPYLEDILVKGRGGEYIGKYLGMMDPTQKAITTIDGRIITAGSLQEMIQRNNILFGQVDFEFSRRSLEGILRQAETTATGQKASAWRQAFRWLRPDRPNFWNTIAQETDNAYRIQAFTDALTLGYTEKQAAEFARRTLLDYSDITEFEARYIAQYFLFYSFMRQSFTEIAGAIGRDPKAIRNVAAAVRFGIDQKKIANTDELFNDTSQKEKALAATWTKLGTSYDKTMTLHYGPAFPSTESFIQLANAMSFAFLDMPSLTGYKPEQSMYNTIVENIILKGNPYMRAVYDSQNKKFRSENAPHGMVPVRMVIALKSSGTFDMAEKYFDIEPVPPEEMRLGNPTYPETGQIENVQYRFATKSGSLRFLGMSLGLIYGGLDRGVQDWASSTAEKLEKEGIEGANKARLKRYTDGSYALEVSGLSTPIAVPTHIEEQDKVMRQIIKEIRAEMD